MQLLTVVNEMLGTLGEAPLSSLAEQHEFKTAAVQALDTHNSSIQAKGWWFNRDNITVPLTADNTLVLPGDTLSYRSYTPGRIKRGGFVYDQINQTYNFTTSDYGMVTRLIPFEDLDELPASYIAAVAIGWFQINYDADRAKVDVIDRRISGLRADMGSEEIRQVGANLLDNNPVLQQIKSLHRGSYR